jgi:hypothetical protein
MKTERAFFFGRERYHYDFEKCKRTDGWKCFDTSQDAWYFGIWCNQKTLQVMTFAEGDETLETCESEAEYHEHLKAMAEAYGDPPPAFITVDDDGQVTHYIDERPK